MPKLDYLMGKMCEVEIFECGKYSMKGKVIEGSVFTPPNTLKVKYDQLNGVLSVSLIKFFNFEFMIFYKFNYRTRETN